MVRAAGGFIALQVPYVLLHQTVGSQDVVQEKVNTLVGTILGYGSRESMEGARHYLLVHVH